MHTPTRKLQDLHSRQRDWRLHLMAECVQRPIDGLLDDSVERELHVSTSKWQQCTLDCSVLAGLLRSRVPSRQAAAAAVQTPCRGPALVVMGQLNYICCAAGSLLCSRSPGRGRLAGQRAARPVLKF